MTSTVRDPIELLRDTLEEQFQRNTDQLAEFTLRTRLPRARLCVPRRRRQSG